MLNTSVIRNLLVLVLVLSTTNAPGQPASALQRSTVDKASPFGTAEPATGVNPAWRPASNNLPVEPKANSLARMPAGPYSAIGEKYRMLGGPGGLLGAPLNKELGAASGGRSRQFQHGYIYWHYSTGAYVIYEKIAARWLASGGEKGPCGYPTGDEFDTSQLVRSNSQANQVRQRVPKNIQIRSSVIYFQTGKIEWDSLSDVMTFNCPLPPRPGLGSGGRGGGAGAQ